jgi:hypothetical protein
LTPAAEAIATMAAKNKCLAPINKSRKAANATKKRPDGSRRIEETGRLRREEQ